MRLILAGSQHRWRAADKKTDHVGHVVAAISTIVDLQWHTRIHLTSQGTDPIGRYASMHCIRHSTDLIAR
jgi:hypothetical protein